jgi:hypothetical protein
VPILLQKSQIAEQQFSREKTRQAVTINLASGFLPKSPVSSSLRDEVPHIFIPKLHLEPREFLISSAKRLLQQYQHKADMAKERESYGLRRRKILHCPQG